MVIEKKFAQYIILAEDSIINALKKISANDSGIVFSVTESGVLQGVVSNGDFRRWLLKQETLDLEQPVAKVANTQFTFAWNDDPPAQIQARFKDWLSIIPLLDRQRRIVSIARKRRSSDGLPIGTFTISESSPVFIIAEIGNNHNGNLETAKELIDAAVVAGANCAKFQMRNLQELYRNSGDPNDAKEDLGAQYTLDLLTRFQLTPEEMCAAFDYCRKRGIQPLCSPWDLDSFERLEEYGIEAYKIASADLTNHDFLAMIAKSGKPMLCSTGMSTEKEIIETVRLLDMVGAKYALLHCNSTYPAPFKDVNLNYLERLKKIGNCPVGYSGHERGIHIALAAVSKGAKIVEKHLTLDKAMEGNDHKVSLLPEEFSRMVQGIRQIELALGSTAERSLSQGEMMNREILAKSLVCVRDVKPGEKISEMAVEIKSPGRGLQPNRKQDLLGLKAKRHIKAGDFFFSSDLEKEQIAPRHYSFKRPWGIPVRYHDFSSLLPNINPDFLEFHLSYKDLDQEIEQFFDTAYNLDLIVHTPELFAGDHQLNLCASNLQYREHSIRELQRVVNITRSLKPYFKRAERPLIVTNLGGFTKDAPLHVSKRAYLYDMIAESLSQLDADGVEIIGQTLPPFPWCFGGQIYHNLFLEPRDTVEFCTKYHYRLCLDISHSKLACTHHHASFKEFIEQVGPYTAHLHVADAKDVDGEGLQLGEGDVDFAALADYLGQFAPRASFIPEIWQGHKNGGEGFWFALEQLEKYF